MLNKWVVVCWGHGGDGCLSSSILFRYEYRVEHLFLLNLAMVQRVTMWNVVSE